MRRGGGAVEADLDGKTRQVKGVQVGGNFRRNEHSVCLKQDALEAKILRGMHKLQPLGVAERFAAGETDPGAAEFHEFGEEPVDNPSRDVAAGPVGSCTDPAMGTEQVAGASYGDGQGGRQSQSPIFQKSQSFPGGNSISSMSALFFSRLPGLSRLLYCGESPDKPMVNG